MAGCIPRFGGEPTDDATVEWLSSTAKDCNSRDLSLLKPTERRKLSMEIRAGLMSM